MKKPDTPEGTGKIEKRCILLVVILLFVAVIPIAAYGIFHSYYSKMGIRPVEENYTINMDVRNDTDHAEDSDNTLMDDDVDSNIEDSPKEEIRSYEDYLAENAVTQEEALKKSLLADAAELPYDSENVYNILLIGTDAKYTNQNSRSDTMMIISINKEKKKIIINSIMRDIYCTIPGVGNTRINHAHAYGGVALLLDTIEYNFGIHIDDYVTINFYGFMDAVDAIGGVPMEVSVGEIKWINFYVDELNALLGEDADTDILSDSDAGELLLNGKQALAYSRIRYVGNADFERTSRQRDVLTAIMEKAKSLSLLELNDLMNTVLPCVTTNLAQGEVLSFLLQAGEYLSYEVDSGRIPVDGSWWNLNIRGMAVLGIDFAVNREYWLERVYGE